MKGAGDDGGDSREREQNNGLSDGKQPAQKIQKKNRKQIVCLCVISALFTVLAGGLAWFFRDNLNNLKEVRAIAQSGVRLGGIIWAATKIPKILEGTVKEFIKTTMLYPIAWLGICIAVPSIIVYAETETAIIVYNNRHNPIEETATAPAAETEEPAKSVPQRNSVSFVWEDNIYISNIQQYYEGTIREEDKSQYAKELILEYLHGIEQTGPYSEDVLNGSQYGTLVNEAGQYHDVYEYCLQADMLPEVQKNMLCAEYDDRTRANGVFVTGLNQEMMGNVKETLADYPGTNWRESMDQALVHYIRALRQSVREIDTVLYVDVLDHLITAYDKISNADGNLEVSFSEICEQCKGLILQEMQGSRTDTKQKSMTAESVVGVS